jgi:uridine kinase
MDFECLDALDVDRLNSDLKKLIAGDAADLPTFDFLTGKRCSETECVRLNDEILILEGIHGLNDELTQGISAAQKFKIFISPLTTLNLDRLNVIVPEDLRLLRRLVRDQRTRGYSFEQTFDVWDSVRRGEFLHILPYQETADVMFNSTLVYEPLILKKHCIGPLRKITPEMPAYARAAGLLKILNAFLSLEDESEVPTRSILREFIG